MDTASSRSVISKLDASITIRIAEQLDIHSLLAWRYTASFFHFVITEQLRHIYTTHLSHFVDHPDTFRHILRITHAAISGSFTLSLFDDSIRPNDLDIYVTEPYAVRLATYLRDVEHYSDGRENVVPYHLSLHTLSPDVHYPMNGIQQLLPLIREQRRIDLIVTTSDSALTPLPYFWSTLVMNFATADFWCCSYPILTVLYHYGIVNAIRVFSTPIGMEKALRCIQKYARRGYYFVFTPAE
ncbi:hypothetical protein A0H81_04990 [Grifola frondosa]|uniref:Uncharacterized protein n=1 Tax=Grifola frondosa TaxID=5627 RepID=A0A1C7MFZ7_GRIFR|nr:hypothetical protein A0H81_04990 [Grifola frondosa]